jgi:hypothetical protein
LMRACIHDGHGSTYGDIAAALWVVYKIPKHGMGREALT